MSFKAFFNLLFNSLRFEFIEENEKLFIDYKNREKILSDFMNDFMINKTNTLWDKNGQFKIPPSIFIQKFLEILKEYLNYTELNYFSIPVIGKISSGKSTFLNSLLGLDCLESNIQITTKFICIIRHNKDNKKPRLFPVILEKRRSEIHKNAYNFIKDDKNELIGDLKTIIHQKNDEIEKCPDLRALPKDKFFYILEANLDIFKGSNFVYSKMFEFLDLPGLNEITEFYLQNIIPIITPNTHFSLFLFDAGNSEDEGTRKLFQSFLKVMNSKAKKNSFFIYNKLDIFKKDDIKENEQILYFKNDILFRTYKLKLKYNHFVGLDSLQLKYDKNKNKKFSDYIKGYIESIHNCDPKRKTKFSVLFLKKAKEDFKIDKFPNINDDEINNNKTYEDTNLLKEVNKSLEEKNYGKIDEKYLIKAKIYYNNYNSEIKGGNEKFEELYRLFNDSFKDTINDFVGNKNLHLLIKTFNTLLIRIYELSKSKEEKKNTKYIIYHLFKHCSDILYPGIPLNEDDLLSDDILKFRFWNFGFEIYLIGIKK